MAITSRKINTDTSWSWHCTYADYADDAHIFETFLTHNFDTCSGHFYKCLLCFHTPAPLWVTPHHDNANTMVTLLISLRLFLTIEIDYCLYCRHAFTTPFHSDFSRPLPFSHMHAACLYSIQHHIAIWFNLSFSSFYLCYYYRHSGLPLFLTAIAIHKSFQSTPSATTPLYHYATYL